MEGRYNTRSPAVKRLMREAQELSEPTDQYYAQPLEDNLFEWHFTVRGPADSDFHNGIYHGRIILPVDYPMKPPSIIWLTPNGRFETNKKICLSISGHHPESWQPSWSIRTALLAIIGFMPTHPGGAIGSLDYKPEERKLLAKKSKEWKCAACGDISNVLLEVSSESNETSKEAKELAAQINFQGEKPKSAEGDPTVVTPTPPCTTAAPAETSPSVTPPSVTTSVEQPRPAGPDVNTYPHMMGAMPSFPSPIGVNPIPPFFPQFSWNLAFNTNVSQAAVSPALMMPRFPYPPSHYSTYSFYPPGCSLPPGVGMFPCPYPEQRTQQTARNVFSLPQHTQIPVNFSANSITSLTPGSPPVVPQGNLQPSDPQLDAVASPSNLPSKSAVSNASSSNDETMVNKQPRPTTTDLPTCACPPNSLLLKELLQKVKRVGSDELVAENVTAYPGSLEQLSVPKSDLTQNTETQDVPTAGQGATASPVSEKPEIESTSGSLHREESLSGVADATDVDQNSDADVPPLENSEAEQRSIFEKSTSSSMSDLDKKRKKAAKGLRQRQSAPGQVQAEEDDVQNSETSELHRIEASSGDTSQQLPRGNHHQGARGVNLVRAQARGVGPVAQRQSNYDASFIVMLGLSVTTAIILLNRLLQFVDWSELFSNSVWE